MPFPGFNPEDQEFFRLFGSLAPQGLPWQDWRQSENIERAIGRPPGNYTPVLPRERVTGIYHPTTLAGGLLSQQAGYSDIDKAFQEAMVATGDPAPSVLFAPMPRPRPR